MRKYFTIIYFISLISVSGNEIKNRCESILMNYFGADHSVSFREFQIPADQLKYIEHSSGQKFFKDKIVVWEIKRNDTLKALGLLDNVYGKSLPITFLTIFDINGEIIKTDIVKYREPYGGGVTDQNWLEQFLGLDGNSSFLIGNDIQSISGATISSRSVTKGIQKLSLLVGEILRNYEYKAVSTK